MFVDTFITSAINNMDRDLSLRYLQRALPGLSITIPHKPWQQQPSWNCQARKDKNDILQPLPIASPTVTTASLDTEWSDSESSSLSDSDWPDWSRWSRRKSSSSSSQTSISTGVSMDEGDMYMKPPAEEVSESLSTESEPKLCKTQTCKACFHSAALHPAKTGYALWVGNLGPKTTLLDLRLLFGTPDLQSIYLIQRTGCAFVNYNTKDALDAAIELFEARGKRLHEHDLVIKTQCTNEESSIQSTDSNTPDSPQQEPPAPSASTSLNRYFICKSLLVDDLEQAKQVGKWSTQLRNKERFNSAFFTSENTYLIFSANRTSAFYGIAKLESPFLECGEAPEEDDNGDAVDDISSNYNSESSASCAEPEVKYTPQMLHPKDGTVIPAGDTVLDPLRGSQFWKVSGCICVEPEVEKWTAPAKITWLSSSSSMVPFSRTRQLKNSLNMNKPIKVARDGTEIDPEVGEKLCKMFN